MKGGQPKDSEPPAANVDPEELSTNREAEVIPWFCGEQIFSARWITDAQNQFTREAPVARPGKK